jgi:hypothetical protein
MPVAHMDAGFREHDADMVMLANGHHTSREGLG